MDSTASLDRRSIVKAAGLGAMAALTQPVAWVRGEETSKPNGQHQAVGLPVVLQGYADSKSWPRKRSGSAINPSSC